MVASEAVRAERAVSQKMLAAIKALEKLLEIEKQTVLAAIGSGATVEAGPFAAHVFEALDANGSRQKLIISARGDFSCGSRIKPNGG